MPSTADIYNYQMVPIPAWGGGLKAGLETQIAANLDAHAGVVLGNRYNLVLPFGGVNYTLDIQVTSYNPLASLAAHTGQYKITLYNLH